jgi:hypothetical protein
MVIATFSKPDIRSSCRGRKGIDGTHGCLELGWRSLTRSGTGLDGAFDHLSSELDGGLGLGQVLDLPSLWRGWLIVGGHGLLKLEATSKNTTERG